jgi:hypothetical protein
MSMGKDHCISSTWVVWGLSRGGSVHSCVACGARMFVRYSSGLCPLCFNGLSEMPDLGPIVPVPHERALAGVLDDPSLEAEPRSE